MHCASQDSYGCYRRVVDKSEKQSMGLVTQPQPEMTAPYYDLGCLR